jgi:hypothetical protein
VVQRGPRRRPGWLLEAGSDPSPRGMAVAEATPDRTRLTGRLALSLIPHGATRPLAVRNAVKSREPNTNYFIYLIDPVVGPGQVSAEAARYS